MRRFLVAWIFRQAKMRVSSRGGREGCFGSCSSRVHLLHLLLVLWL